jgi:mono/diheme cytochrome c family protein
MMVTRITVSVVALGALALLAAPAERQASATTKAKQIERGKEIVWSVGCNDCHTPKKMGPNGPEPDTDRLLSGHRESPELPAPPKLPAGPWGIVTNMDLTAWSGPWGITYSANLTPDENTGLGIWTEDMFIRALRTGRHMGASRPILPPMPWQVYGRFSDEDLKAVYAYLRSLKPIHNRVPAPVIAEPVAVAQN